MTYNYKYSYRAVAFLDVLGFKNKLQEFEQDAEKFYNDQRNTSDDDTMDESNVENGHFYYSSKAADFIETFNSAISKLDKDKFSYYLFSDNICITAHNSEDDAKLLIELLLVVSELYYEFIKKGYFLRGGIDYGLFIDKSSIALGIPLANAYQIESLQAVFPRIVLSNNFIKQLEDYTNRGYEGFLSILANTLIKKSCEIHYLNVFVHIFKVEDKEIFFNRYCESISTNLESSIEKENIFLKYQWLANEYDSFIEEYTSSLAYYDEDYEPTEEYIEKVKQSRITYGH